ncbi:FAD-dependent oxidoreductase [Candidatus Woesearchaeota archaeon]|nr:FAD-dependent oxidoreductase [Candidatus Woesearchaeota archaeon]
MNDIIILGAGIAGCGLAYNLSRRIGSKRIKIIDPLDRKKGLHNLRGTFHEVIREYNLPYEHIFKGVCFGDHRKKYLVVNEKLFIIDYNKICNYLLSRSNIKLIKEKALSLENNSLITDKKKYKYQYIIDCTGMAFFARRLLKLPLPKIYMYGNRRVIIGKIEPDEYVNFLSEPDGYVEEFYTLNNKILQGDWGISQKVDLSKITPRPYSFYHRIEDRKIASKEFVMYPISPVMPLKYRNIAFLGDAFGNATPSTGEGIRPILDSSKILARAIELENLDYYQNQWKQRYLDSYLKNLITKLDLKNRVSILKVLQKNTDNFIQMIKCQGNGKSKLLIRKLPKRMLFKYAFIYGWLYTIYSLSEYKHKINELLIYT